MNLINYSYLFDLFRNLYADLSYKTKHIKTGYANIPLRYFLELTYRCNLNCPYCYIGRHRELNELTTEEWINTISQIPRYGIITLVGGEPLIRDDFYKILNYSSKRVFKKVNVVTNGILLNNEAVKNIVKSNIILLSVSLDGWEKTHDLNRGMDNIFDKITTNLENFNSKRKNTMVDIKTIVLNNNIEDLYKLYKYSTEMGFEYLSISFLRNNNLKQNPDLLENFEPVFYEQKYDIKPYFNMEHFEDIYKRIISLSKKSKTRIRFSPKFEEHNPNITLKKIKNFFEPKNPDLLKRHPSEIYEPCKYPFSNIMINPSGDVYPCLSFKIGNIKNYSIKEVFNLPKYKCFRKNLKTSKVFSSCQMCCELKVKDIKDENK